VDYKNALMFAKYLKNEKESFLFGASKFSAMLYL